MPSAIPRGRFVWHELLTSDPDGETSFYTSSSGGAPKCGKAVPAPIECG